MTPVRPLSDRLSKAVAKYWHTRKSQSAKQSTTGRSDRGARSAVTGGAHMDGFVDLLAELMVEAGASKTDIYRHKRLELPGFFRPTKEWDLLLVRDHQLIVAIETKSQVGPSFGNNFNNRTEEAMGSALDLWTAYREGAFNGTVKPWLGYLFLLEDCPESCSPVKVKEPHFAVFPEFKNASYAKRYELFCQKLVRENKYNVASFLTSDRTKGRKGEYNEPAADLTFDIFTRALKAQVTAFGAQGNQ